MHRAMLFLTLLALSAHISSHPIFLLHFTLPTQSDNGWLWSWAWGADSTVSVVDRSPVLTFPSRPAAFGPDLLDPLLGYVIPLSSFTEPCPSQSGRNTSSHESTLPSNLGCPTLCVRGPNEPEKAETWIALVQRGSCQFVDKVRESQRLGANAVVVGGDDPEVSGNPDALVNMYSPDDSSDITIPSTFIKFSDYVILSNLIATSNTSHSGLRTLSLQIATEYSPWEWYSPIITFVIILVLPSLLTLATLLIHRVRASRAARRDRAPEDVVKCLPWKVWTGTGWEKHQGSFPGSGQVDVEATIDGKPATVEDAPDPELNTANDPSTSQHLAPPPNHEPWFESQHECAICLSSFVKGDHVRVLPCQHIFHLDEVDVWLIHRKKLCPVCKADVTQPPPHKPSSPFSPPPATDPSSTETVGLPTPPQPSSVAGATERTPLLESSNRIQSESV